ncbi:MAG: two-component sensor histidine kinase [Lachnospiraceae bacterium]|jgi:signal transduction histidine kinase|nr:two-component sensor histidine kinase [Lachnospiraceae bacterium]
MSKIRKEKSKINSIQFRVFLLILLFGIGPMFVMRFGVLRSFEEKEVSAKTLEISNQSKLLATQIASTDYLNNQDSEVIDAQLNQLSNVYDGRIMLIDSAYTIVKDTYQMDEGKVITSQEVVTSFAGTVNSRYDRKYGYLEMTLPIVNPNNQDIMGVFVINMSANAVMANRDFYWGQANVLIIILTILVFFGSVGCSELLIIPFKKMKFALEQRKNGLVDEEIHVTGCAETEMISEEINGLLNNMKVLDESRQEFVSNVSHELKTPITSMKVLAESLLSQEDAPAELYREFMEDIANEVERESKIISDLLSLVKMDKSATKPEITLVNINEFLETILKRIQPIAEAANVELVLESFRPVSAEIDEVKLSLAVSNLVENAVKYNNKEGGWVHVTLNADHQFFYLTVEDNGIGIPQDSIEHIFERFYRVDKSHSREIGGTGLGLAITRNSILLHRGAIKVHSELGVGTTFSVRIPLNYIS